MNPDRDMCQFLILLEGIEPQIWRRLLVPEGFTLADVHTIVQVAMPWKDYHLHQFRLGELTYGRPDYDERPELLDERKIRLCDFDLSAGDKLGYEYDFGDGWEHVLLLEQKQPSQAGAAYPVCVAGERAAPPEDVGGPPGYEDFLKAISNRRDKRHREMMEWIGGSFDPGRFDLIGVNRRLRMRFGRRKTR